MAIIYNQSVVDAVFLRENLVLIKLNKQLVVDDDYYSTVGITLTPIEESAQIAVRKIFTLSKNTQACDSILIITDNATEGAQYYLDVPPKVFRDGTTFDAFRVYLKYTRTKSDNISQSIPSHFDKQVTSNMSGLLGAIGKSDQVIGGARNEIAYGAISTDPSVYVTVNNAIITIDGNDLYI